MAAGQDFADTCDSPVEADSARSNSATLYPRSTVSWLLLLPTCPWGPFRISGAHRILLLSMHCGLISEIAFQHLRRPSRDAAGDTELRTRLYDAISLCLTALPSCVFPHRVSPARSPIALPPERS